MKQNLEGLDGYEKVKDAVDGIGIIQLIRSVCYSQDKSRHGMLEIVKAHWSLSTCFQHESESARR